MTIIKFDESKILFASIRSNKKDSDFTRYHYCDPNYIVGMTCAKGFISVLDANQRKIQQVGFLDNIFPTMPVSIEFDTMDNALLFRLACD